ncbi:MAG: SpoIIE family protein phosphatase [Anaerolineales bacterium]|nr:SpoIIE family protein phosphatase [Anaerolineales bacterium]
MTYNLLSQIPLFADLSSEELGHIQSVLDVQELAGGEILFREGEIGERLYIVVNGIIEVLMGEGKEEMLLNVLRTGEYLGEMGLILPGGRRTATVRAREKSVLLSMSRAQFLELARKNPQLSVSMVRVLSQRLDAANTHSFHDLTEKNKQLQAAYDDLKSAQIQIIEKERLERELQVAADIQLSILPDELPELDEFDFGARILPARQVGGDFYDIFQLNENQVGVVIGDVADKGVPSAIFMARVHALIMAETDINATSGEVMQAVNRHITRLQKSTQFVTALYGILDLKTRAFNYARAGHEPPLLLYADGTVERLPHGSGMALGLWGTVMLDERAVTLPRGSTLLLFTDGLTDCRDPNGELFGLERIKQKLSELNNNNAQQICDRLLASLKKYQAGSKQDDDVTLVAVHTFGGDSTIKIKKRQSELGE